MSELVNEFNDYRSKMNDVILGKQNKVISRLFNLDTNTYAEGALSTKTKEMLGLVASMVLRCDDCIKYHLGKCHEEGLTTRRGAEYWEELNKS
jgi:AhpD family alkylhydroperoxidase